MPLTCQPVLGQSEVDPGQSPEGNSLLPPILF